ncbi:MAG: SMC-Scp complex subunit ScpB [Pelagibacterales bacterium]|nr:SMC-Scp complex subunit ScpB [Pelagibacterales bacterium]|tara:strand:+ start:2089 stop:2655 length:567 start_codon:yes stop_codon:yes gene_type:complete
MSDDIYMNIVEAIIFASDKPVSNRVLASKLPDHCNVSEILQELKSKYTNRGVNLSKVGDSWAFRTAPEVAEYLIVEKTVQKKLSKAALEILSIIAYHQPITRAEIEDMRGVSVSQGSLEMLFEANWVEPRGYKDVPGRPATWRTSKHFLDHFGLESIKDLPGLSELKASGLLARNTGPSYLNSNNINN